MTLEELKAAGLGLADEFIDEYYPLLAKMGIDELLDLIALIASGKEMEAWGIVLEQKSGADALAEAKAITASWNHANKANAESLALQKKAITAILSGVLTITLALVGL